MNKDINAIGIVRQMIADGQVSQEVAEKYFPELKESEDERIRKSLLTFFQRFPYEIFGDLSSSTTEAIAWLEKQGQKETLCDKCRKEQPSHSCQDITELGRCALEKQGEQKPFDYENANIQQKDFAPKIEPKFKVGDWIMYCGKPYQITGLHNDTFTLTSCNGSYFFNNVKSTKEPVFHLWTIQDAKDGDALVASDGSIFLFKDTIDCACRHYVALTTDDVVEFNEGFKHFWETSRAVHPATKEQRDLLFQKMKEAGYEWDADKKELKKIEQKPVEFCEEDEKIRKAISIYLDWLDGRKDYAPRGEYSIRDMVDWLESLKQMFKEK